MRLILQMPCAEYCRLWGFSWGFIVFVIFSGVFDVEGVFMALLLVLIVSWQFAFLSPPKSPPSYPPTRYAGDGLRGRLSGLLRG